MKRKQVKIKFDLRRSLVEQLGNITYTPTEDFSLSLFNLLGDESVNLPQVFSAIPGWVRHLDLRGNSLGDKLTSELKAAFDKLTDSIETINLSMNELQRKSGSELALILKSIRAPHLILEQNSLDEVADLKTPLENIHLSTTRLNISDNGLYSKESKHPVAMLAVIRVPDLNISYNFTLNVSMAVFKTYLQSFSKEIHTLRWHDLLEAINEEVEIKNTCQRLSALSETSIGTLDLGNPYFRQGLYESGAKTLANAIFNTGKEVLIEGPLKKYVIEKQKELRAAIEIGLFAVDKNKPLLDGNTKSIVFSYLSI